MGSSIVLKGTSSAVRQYRCNGDMRAIHCPAPASVSDARLEPYVEALFWQELGRAPRPKRSRRIAKLEEAVERRERELNAYRDNARLPITLGPDRFADGLDVRTRRQARARLDVVQARRAASSPKLPSPDELRRLWPSLSVAERRAAIGEVIDCIVVWPGPNQPIEARSAVFLAGQAPSDLPRPYEWNIQPRAIDKAAHQSGRPRLRPTEDWTLERVRAELDPFLEGRDRWPSFPEFQAAGLATLYEQTLRHAHPNRWAQRTGLPLVFATPNGRRWSEPEIRKELTAFLAGRRQWPSFAEFRDAGRVYLRTAVTAFGGPERWACEMGVELPADRRGHEPQWTYPRMREAIAELAKGRSTWPRQAEFTGAGLRAVHKITHQKKLRPQLARELGLALPAERRSPRRWSDDEIRAALDDFLKGRSTWPGHREFGRAGLGGLLRLITMRGEREKWACEYDVDPPAPPFRWTDDKIEAALDTFLEGRHEWPTWSEFQQAGLVGLITNLSRAGSRRAWAERYGLVWRVRH
jgi:hypothetical protein